MSAQWLEKALGDSFQFFTPASCGGAFDCEDHGVAIAVRRKTLEARAPKLRQLTSEQGRSLLTVRNTSAEALDVFWSWLSEADPTCEELEASVMLRRLQDMNPDENREGAIGEGPDFVDWKSFAKALGAAPFERW